MEHSRSTISANLPPKALNPTQTSHELTQLSLFVQACVCSPKLLIILFVSPDAGPLPRMHDRRPETNGRRALRAIHQHLQNQAGHYRKSPAFSAGPIHHGGCTESY